MGRPPQSAIRRNSRTAFSFLTLGPSAFRRWSLPSRSWVARSKHYCAGNRHDFEEAVGALADAADFWRGESRPLCTLIGGPDGWKSGWLDMPLK